VVSALFLGIGLGLGLWALAVWVIPPRPSLHMVLARITASPSPPPILIAEGTNWTVRLGAPLEALGLPGERTRRDLTTLGRPVGTHLTEKATLAIAGVLGPVLLQGLLLVAGARTGFDFPIIAGIVLAGMGFLWPDLRVRAAAARLQSEFRHALSCYLDLVWITLAGGAGVDSALHDSAAVGQGWAFAQIRQTLSAARLTRSTPWARLHQLGDELGVTELAELAASVSLAGTEGAKVRASLAAKAAALRAHQLSNAEAEAQSATERMSLPVMVLLLGFLAFITYPALTQVLNGL
jgi:Flp pilus assembly protein TadB